MATTNMPGGPSGGNPPIVDVEPVSIWISPEHAVGGIVVEITDGSGNGFRTVLDQTVALDVTLRLVGSLARLRGWAAAP